VAVFAVSPSGSPSIRSVSGGTPTTNTPRDERGAMSTHVVTCFLRDGTDVLLTRRSGEVGTYTGRWAGVSGYVEDLAAGQPVDTFVDARREVREETGLVVDENDLARAGEPLAVHDADADRDWTVHPFLFDVGSREVAPNEELAAVEWVQPPAMLDRETVPGLWAAYERVAPTVETVRGDAEHGSASVSVRALEVLRDRAAAVAAGVAGPGAGDGQSTAGDDRSTADSDGEDGWSAVAETARALRDARPSMAAVANRVNRALADADRTPAAVRDRAIEAVAAALRADEAAATNAADRLASDDVDSVATLSRSGTVLAALREARPAVLVGESRPAREGVAVAETLAADGLDVTLTTDAALPALLGGPVAAPDPGRDRAGPKTETGTGDLPAPDAEPADAGTADGKPADDPAVDAVLVGADAVLADGSVVNKAGTRALALAAAHEGVPTYVAAARDKVRPDEVVHGESGDAAAVYDGDEPVRVACPTFDRTPAALVDGVVTEDGVLDVATVREVAAEHRRAAGWDRDEPRDS
jgi:translation initiation factor 2B subunit (eIF-2B alpha/beta/delta family)